MAIESYRGAVRKAGKIEKIQCQWSERDDGSALEVK